MQWEEYWLIHVHNSIPPKCANTYCDNPTQMHVKGIHGFRMYCSDYCRGFDQGVYNHKNLPGFTDRARHRLIELWKIPEYREQQSKNFKLRRNTLEFRELHRNIMQEYWDDPEFRFKCSNNWGVSGTHKSVKSGEVYFRSSWERRAYEILDQNPEVLRYEAEPQSIKYVDPEGIVRNYYPDILIEFVDQSRVKEVIEIKPKYLVDTPENQCKFLAADRYCFFSGMIFDIWTEDRLW